MTDTGLDEAFVFVIDTGVKLSILLYHFASPLGSVGDDMKDLAAEVTLFCAIMRQVGATFHKPKSFRVSDTAVHDVYDVLERGGDIFERIRKLYEKLQGPDGTSTTNLSTRIKETFRRTKVLMWKESLRSCTATIQVMLITMTFAERIATTGPATPSSQAEDERLRDLMQSLLLVQQSTNRRLERLEEQAIDEIMLENPPSESPSDNMSTEAERAGPRGRIVNSRHNRSSNIILGIDTEEITDLLGDGNQRTSVLLNRKVFQQDNFEESQRRTWTSVSDREHSVAQSNGLLKSWTDQSDPSPPYALSLHEAYGAAIERAEQSQRANKQPDIAKDRPRQRNTSNMLRRKDVMKGVKLYSPVRMRIFYGPPLLKEDIDLQGCESVDDVINLLLRYPSKYRNPWTLAPLPGRSRDYCLWTQALQHLESKNCQMVSDLMFRENYNKLPSVDCPWFLLSKISAGPPTIEQLRELARIAR